MVTLNFGSAHHYLLSVRITGVSHHTQFYTLCQGSDPGLQACCASVLSAELGSYVLPPSHQSAFSVPAVYLCRLQCDGNRMVDGIFECLPPCGSSHLLFPMAFHERLVSPGCWIASRSLNVPCLFIHALSEGQLGCFQILAVLNQAL